MVQVLFKGTMDRPTFTARETTGSAGVSRPVVLESACHAIEQLPTEGLRLGRLRSSVACRVALMRLAGAQDLDYDLLNVLLGHATAFAYHPQRYQPLFATPEPEEVVEPLVASATGLLWERHASGSAEAVWELLKASIVSGRPMAAAWVDDVILCGYEESEASGARRVLVAAPGSEPVWWTWDMLDKWAAEFGHLGRTGAPCPRAPIRDAVRNVVRMMVRCADKDPRAAVTEMRHAVYGLEAVWAFRQDIADLRNSPDYWHPGWLGGPWVYLQITGRSSAARVLRRWADDLGGPAAEHVRSAARLYGLAAERWQEWGRHLGAEAGMPDMEDIRLLWLRSDNRLNGARAVDAAWIAERDAVRQLKLALARGGML